MSTLSRTRSRCCRSVSDSPFAVRALARSSCTRAPTTNLEAPLGRAATLCNLAVLCVVAALLAGCTLVPTPPSLPTPVRPPDIGSTAQALQAAVAGDYPVDALTLSYQVGNPAWDGQTTLVVRGSGSVDVTFRQGDTIDTWQATLPEARVLDLVRLLVDQEVWAIRGQRTAGVPDEAYPTVTVHAEGFPPLQAGMWAGEAETHPGFRPIVDAFSALARELSGGIAR
jgi:hypothetical protein